MGYRVYQRGAAPDQSLKNKQLNIKFKHLLYEVLFIYMKPAEKSLFSRFFY